MYKFNDETVTKEKEKRNFEQRKYSGGSGTVVSLGRNLYNS